MQPQTCLHQDVAPGSVCPACGVTTSAGPSTDEHTRLAAPDAPRDAEETRLGGELTGLAGVPDLPNPSDQTGPPEGSFATTVGAAPAATGAGRGAGGATSTAWRLGPLTVGQDFGRYHIIKLLGVGGMGAVYQAWDSELNVPVAVKLIRPEISADPKAAEDLERRFKRELLLARQVTHKNVVRIHDLGEIDGIKYITMPYIHGRDLSTALSRDNRLPIARVVAIARQVASGLVAAHEAGIVHRDLKPANIMIDDDGQASIMDFGIARSAASTNQTMGVVGTVAYMAPEQATGQVTDQRADVYAFGLIVRDLLIGPRDHGGGESAVAELMHRIQQAPPSPRAIDSSVPEALDRIVARCLEPNPAKRYQTSAELAADLARLDDHGVAVGAGLTGGLTPARRSRKKIATVAAIAGLALAVAAVVIGIQRWKSQPAAAPTEAVSLAVVPFRNASGDTSLNGWGITLAEILRAELGQSTHLRTVPSDRLRQVLRDLRLEPESEFDEQTLRRLGEFSNAQTIVWGQYLKIGNQVQILATLQDLRPAGGSTTLKAEAADQGALLGAVHTLADQVRQRLASSPEVLNELAAASLKPSSASFEALRYYQEGIDLVRQGNHSDAVKRFTLATNEDPQFALAYSKLAQANAALGYDADAARFSRRAIDLSAALPPQEKYLIEATAARIRNDSGAALVAYENLRKASPNDATILFDLGGLYENTGALQNAQEAYTQALQHDPKSVDVLLANGRIRLRQQKPQEALEFLTTAQGLAIQLSYEVSQANVLHALGVAYSQLDKPTDAQRYFRESLEIKRRLGQKSGIAASLNELAQVQVRLGQQTDAMSSFNEALALRRDIGDKRGIARVLINLASLQNDTGESNAALGSLREALQIEREVGDQQAIGLCLNFIGSIYFSKGQYDDAVTYFERALPIREKVNVPGEIADTLHNLAEAAVKMGQHDKATAEYLRALQLRRGAGDARGAAIESYSLGTVYELQGRVGPAVKAKEEALASFRALKDRSFWMAEILRGYGVALSQAGRMDKAAPVLEEAQNLARELKNPVLIAQGLQAEADRRLFLGDAARAKSLYDDALREAERTTDAGLILSIKVRAAGLALQAQPAAATLKRLTELEREAEQAGLKNLAIECALFRAEVSVAGGEHAAVRPQLESLVGRGEALGIRLQTAQAHHLLGTVLDALKEPAEARRQFALAQRLFEQMRDEEGGASVLKRADLEGVYADSVKRAAAR